MNKMTKEQLNIIVICSVCKQKRRQGEMMLGTVKPICEHCYKKKGGENMKQAYFAGGCFWCITPTFQEMEGVTTVTSGYSGGEEVDPTYEDVKYQRTGHRETIRIAYDEDLVSYAQLLDIFLSGVDPFDEGGQFIDRGHSYTLAVYHCSESQRQVAEAGIRALEAESGQAVYISVEPFKSFYRAEEEHQDYYLKHPEEFRQELIDSGRVKA